MKRNDKQKKKKKMKPDKKNFNNAKEYICIKN